MLGAGLVLAGLTEHDSVPWNAIDGKMTMIGGGEWRLADNPARLPHTFTLRAVRPRP